MRALLFYGTLQRPGVLFLRALLELQKNSLSHLPHVPCGTSREIPGCLCNRWESCLFGARN